MKARTEAADRAAEVEAEVGVSTTEAEGSVIEGSRNRDVGLISTTLLPERDQCVAVWICSYSLTDTSYREHVKHLACLSPADITRAAHRRCSQTSQL